MMTSATLDPLTLPLHGSRLMEASAGTGKTFTIALLYVRLVLGGHRPDDDTAFVRPLTPPEILVVTFTNAATQELRERIRTRLVEAADAFLADADDSALDPLLLNLRGQYPEDTWIACARRLALAAEWMDEAAVSTIHSWCYRMLREHAFDSGSLFSLDLEHDQSELIEEVVRDYWRCFYYPLDAATLGQISRHWDSPEALYQALRNLLNESDALPDAPPPERTLREAEAERTRLLNELKAPWPAWLDELEPALEDAAGRKAFDGRKFKSNSRKNWLGALREWSGNEAADRPALTDAAWQRLTPDGMAEIWKDGEPPCPEAWQALAALPEALDALPEPRADLLTHAVHWCRARLASEQERRAEMGPNDLLTHLDRALQGPGREALAEQIRQQFPVALIDEFQDTDPVQYRIFNAVYEVATPRRDTAIMLIGDPKQAIYAFRGADIFTYLQARRDTAGRHVTLGKNFRSSAAMVEAVNHCLAYADDQASGAFLFRQGNDNPLPFHRVDARGRDEQLTLDGETLPAMTFWQLNSDDGKPLGKGVYQDIMASGCASHMVSLLNAGREQRAGFRDEQTLTPLQPSDMAVLVNNGTEARAIRQALARRGVRSVYLSDRDKVFSSPMAPQVAHWLAACSEPPAGSRQAQSRLRAALATPALGLSLEALDRLMHNELAREERIEQFHRYHRLWQRRGVLPLLRRIMVDFAIPARLLGQNEHSAGDDSGERLLTDLLHLGELLQEASQELDGEQALLRFLDEAIADPERYGDSHRLRLESDADLVKVVTIHKAKGLEYPLVFLPFIANYRPAKKDDTPLRRHDADGTLRLHLDPDDDALAAADRERLGEDMRKLYVALTRARHAVWLGVAPLEHMDERALGHLLAGRAVENDALDALATNGPIRVAAVPEASDERFIPPRDDAALIAARTPARRAREHWWIASYSALTLSGALTRPAEIPPAAAEPATAQDATALEVLDEPRDDQATGQPAAHLHRFPRGPGPGTFLHGLLEWAGREGFATVPQNADALHDTLRRRLQLRGWQRWHDALADWLSELVSARLPLPASAPARNVTLTELADYQVELEFWFAAGQVDTLALDRIVCQHLLTGQERPALERDTLNGMLKGFIDLAFAHDGRFYVLDWKSNYLGNNDEAYTPDAMRRALLNKRYDVQSALYLLAMHRLLKARLPDYDPAQHLGGAMTVFLRGSGTPARGVHAEPATAGLVNALDALFAGSPADDSPHRSTQEEVSP
ncbi:exodeoxyribonuclease V subunit beta [Vreelandella jeotgali]|uniref:exodeoxyribonuclease V subunit beta n=1 Tax=Vreelandella jeotgali TaxID=553386 RepID=UPI000346BEEB